MSSADGRPIRTIGDTDQQVIRNSVNGASNDSQIV